MFPADRLEGIIREIVEARRELAADNAVAESGEWCTWKWKSTASFKFVTSCGNESPPLQGSFCPYCGKPVRVP